MANEYLRNDNTITWTNPQKMTLSFWVKRNEIDAGIHQIFTVGTSANNNNYIMCRFNDDVGGDTIRFTCNGNGVGTVNLFSKQKFRSQNDWYHFVWRIDTTQVTASDRVRLYLNGDLQELDTSPAQTYPGLNGNIIDPSASALARFVNSNWTNAQQGDHQLSDMYFVDGQSHEPEVFGRNITDPESGIQYWKARPPAYIRTQVTFGGAGFYLPLNTENKLQPVAGSHRYWRYVEGTSFNGHHPRVSRLYFVTSDGNTTNFQTYTSDNFSDSGEYVIGTQSADFTTNVEVVGVGGFVTFNGYRSADFTVQYSDDFANWTNAFVGRFSADEYGEHTFYPQVGWDYQTSDRSVKSDFYNLGVTDQMASRDSSTNNFCNMNPMSYYGTANTNIIDNGGRRIGDSNSIGSQAHGTLVLPSAGKWYWEVGIDHASAVNSSTHIFGVVAKYKYEAGNAHGYRVRSGAQIYKDIGGNSSSSGAAAWANNDVIQLALDFDNRKFWIGRNGAWYVGDPNTHGSGATFDNIEILEDGYLVLLQIDNQPGTKYATFNFGQGLPEKTCAFTSDDGYGVFRYQPPTGFDCICEANIRKHRSISFDPKTRFGIKTWAGNTTDNHTISYDFTPDLIFIKSYSGNEAHHWRGYDSVRSSTSCPALYVNQNVIEDHFNDDPHLSFSNNSITMLANPNGNNSHNGINKSGTNYIGYAWGTNNASLATNNDGNVTSYVKADPESGFSVASFSHNGATTTFGHGLNKAPDFMIVKGRNQTYNWDVYHWNVGATARTRLNESSAPEVRTEPWNNTEPTNSIVTMGAWYAAGTSTIAYMWHAVDGYSAFGQYTATDSVEGRYLYCGFKPAFVLVRAIGPDNANTNWTIFDNTRTSLNPNDKRLEFDTFNFENGDGRNTNNSIDILSDGFRVTSANWYETNTTLSSPYIYAAFAESPSWLNKGK